MRIILRLLAIVIVLFIGWLLLAPTPVEPVAWTPPASPPDAQTFAYNDKLKNLERLLPDVGHGPEGIAVDASGQKFYTGYHDGTLVEFSADGQQHTVLGNTGGRPLGLRVMPNGSLIIADAHKGLIQGREQYTVLATTADDLPFGFTDDLDVDHAALEVYFTDASSKFGYGHHMEDIIEHGANGRLLAYNLQTQSTRTLISGMHFPNGVAIGPNAEYVLVNETAEYRVLRYWLKGDKAGTHDIFIDNLPGFPDNITFNGKDRFWLALAGPRDALLDGVADKPFVRKMIARLPAWMQPGPKRHAQAYGLDLDGKVIANLQYAGADAFAPLTSVLEAGSYLYFGSLTEPAVGRLPLETAIPGAQPVERIANQPLAGPFGDAAAPVAEPAPAPETPVP